METWPGEYEFEGSLKLPVGKTRWLTSTLMFHITRRNSKILKLLSRLPFSSRWLVVREISQQMLNVYLFNVRHYVNVWWRTNPLQTRNVLRNEKPCLLWFSLDFYCIKQVGPQTNVRNKKENCILPKISLITDAYE